MKNFYEFLNQISEQGVPKTFDRMQNINWEADNYSDTYKELHAALYGSPQEFHGVVKKNGAKINSLSDYEVYKLLKKTNNSWANVTTQEIANALGQKNINKLEDQEIKDLLWRANDRAEMASILGSENIKKLDDEFIQKLINDTGKFSSIGKRNELGFILRPDLYK